MTRHSTVGAILLALCCVLTGPLLNSGVAIPVGERTRFSSNPTWSDEFTGNSLDASKWVADQGPWNSQINDPAAVSLNGSGQLVLTTFSVNNGGALETHCGFLNAYLQSRYGYFESRIKWHDALGTLSCFWFDSPTIGNPLGNPAVAGTEVDIAEHFGDPTNYSAKTIHQAVIWDGYGADEKELDNTTGDVGADSGYHLYGLAWDPNGYRFYVDNMLTWTCTSEISQRWEGMTLSSVIASWTGDPPAGGYGSLATSTTKMTVDYVHYYALVPEPSALAMLAAVLIGAMAYIWRKGRR